RLVWLERFAEWHALWGKEGVMAVLRRVLVETGVRQRLVAEPGGERALTNFLHLAELLHTEETTRRLAPESLFAWFWQQRQGSERKEEAQLRLESDAAAVEIVTVHWSKGLEYRLVFCPCLLAPAVNERKR